jgi:hypothetical protein
MDEFLNVKTGGTYNNHCDVTAKKKKVNWTAHRLFSETFSSENYKPNSDEFVLATVFDFREVSHRPSDAIPTQTMAIHLMCSSRRTSKLCYFCYRYKDQKLRQRREKL